MCGIGDAAFAGWMPDVISCPHEGTRLHPVLRCHVHVEDVPASLLVSISIEVLDHRSLVGAHDEPVGRSDNPLLAHGAAHYIRRSKIKRTPGGTGIPRCMWTAGECPGGPMLERPSHARLRQVGRQD